MSSSSPAEIGKMVARHRFEIPRRGLAHRRKRPRLARETPRALQWSPAHTRGGFRAPPRAAFPRSTNGMTSQKRSPTGRKRATRPGKQVLALMRAGGGPSLNREARTAGRYGVDAPGSTPSAPPGQAGRSGDGPRLRGGDDRRERFSYKSQVEAAGMRCVHAVGPRAGKPGIIHGPDAASRLVAGNWKNFIFDPPGGLT